MKHPKKIAVDEIANAVINGQSVQIFRKTKYVYVVQDLAGKKICSGPSLPKVIKKAEGKIELVETKPKKSSASTKSMKSICLDMITGDSADADIVDAVKKQFPDAKFDMSHVSWYRSTMFRDGVITAEHAPRRSKAYKLWKESQAA